MRSKLYDILNLNVCVCQNTSFFFCCCCSISFSFSSSSYTYIKWWQYKRWTISLTMIQRIRQSSKTTTFTISNNHNNGLNSSSFLKPWFRLHHHHYQNTLCYYLRPTTFPWWAKKWLDCCAVETPSGTWIGLQISQASVIDWCYKLTYLKR